MQDFFTTFQLEFQVLIKVALAMAMGAAIGFERELKDKPAGLRTHMLVTGAATLLVALGDIVIEHFAVDAGSQLVRSDPVRIIEAVITGVSFLGAGTILRPSDTDRIEGLTTAASILFAAAVGVGVALSQWVITVGSTLLVLVTLRGLGTLEGWIAERGG